jgi:superfamily II DNA or RNA helicase
MALKLDPVRLLIADDVGIGKTIEAGLVARELLDQGDASRLAVLCPPHLAEQWQAELAEKFHIEADLVLASTAARLERGLRPGTTIFDTHPFVIVSTDFIKAERRRNEFLRTCPELVIVDEAHTCADPGEGRTAKHQRYDLVAGLAANRSRHLLLVTATPHSGKEGAFRSLLTLLDESFASLPDDVSGDANRRHREQLARHLVQRRRADIRVYLDAETSFPDRLEREETYELTAEYRNLFDRVLAYARETVRDPDGGVHRQRVRWWSALALLRSLASSPAAAAATLRTRAAAADTDTIEEADEVGRRTVLDLGDDETELIDVVAGSDPDVGGDDTARARRRLRDLAREADALSDGDADLKLARAAKLLAKLIADGFSPIVFCRFIPTAEYVASELRRRLGKSVEVAAVTGRLHPDEREARIEALGEFEKRVLVCTDCLSEGINLQRLFDSVFHYDLPWNPTRLEQREGRVDRFGQDRPEVRVVTYYGDDNQIDQIVLDVLLRKHRKIRRALGISIPVPGDTNSVIEALTEGVLLRQDQGSIAQVLPGMGEFLRPKTEQLLLEWDNAADHEQRSRSIFNQSTINVEDVAREVDAVRAAIGSGAEVEAFVRVAVPAYGGVVREGIGSRSDTVELELSEVPVALRDSLPAIQLKARFSLPSARDEVYLGRTHPFVSGLATFVLDSALDPLAPSVATRCGVIRTDAVRIRTTLLLTRYRFHLVTIRSGSEQPLIAEDSGVLGFTGSPLEPSWIQDEDLLPLLQTKPTANVSPIEATDFLRSVIEAASSWRPHLDDNAAARAESLLASHERVREAARQKGVRFRVSAQLPADVLGVYVFLPTRTMS